MTCRAEFVDLLHTRLLALLSCLATTVLSRFNWAWYTDLQYSAAIICFPSDHYGQSPTLSKMWKYSLLLQPWMNWFSNSFQWRIKIGSSDAEVSCSCISAPSILIELFIQLVWDKCVWMICLRDFQNDLCLSLSHCESFSEVDFSVRWSGHHRTVIFIALTLERERKYRWQFWSPTVLLAGFPRQTLLQCLNVLAFIMYESAPLS